MKIAFGNDHAAFAQRPALLELLHTLGHEVLDFGSDSEEAVDYPDVGRRAAEALSRGEAERAILACGSGIGMALAANKVVGVRCAQATDLFEAVMSRRHNDVNALSLRCRHQALEDNLAIVEHWLKAEFVGGRHQRRVDKIMQIEHDRRTPAPGERQD